MPFAPFDFAARPKGGVWILDRDNMGRGHLGAQQFPQQREDRGRLPAGTRPREQDHPLGPPDQVAQHPRGCGVESKVFDIEHLLRCPQDAHHDLLPVDGWKRGHAHRIPARRLIGGNAAVLRLVFLIDHHLGHHLDPGGDARLVRIRDVGDIVQDAVDSKPQGQAVGPRLEMDVAGAVIDRLRQGQIDRQRGPGVARFEQFLQTRLNLTQGQGLLRRLRRGLLLAVRFLHTAPHGPGIREMPRKDATPIHGNAARHSG